MTCIDRLVRSLWKQWTSSVGKWRAARYARSAAANETAGFTLIELVVVIAIVAVLAGIIGPRVFGQLSSSKVKATEAQIELLSTALESFRLDNGRFPTQGEGLIALVERPDTLSGWAGPYLRKRLLPKDGWDRDFIYEIPASKGGIDFDLYALGADGSLGGEGDDADIGNW